MQPVQSLLPSKRLLRHLKFEFSNSEDLLDRFPVLTQKYIRYFRGLRDLVLVFRNKLSREDWEVLPGQNILSGKDSDVASRTLTRALDWLPVGTKVTVVGANLGEAIGWTRKEGTKDQQIEEVVESMFRKSELK
jgi:hypothetical protein